MKTFAILIGTFFAQQLFSQQWPTQGPLPEMVEQMAAYNKSVTNYQRRWPTPSPYRATLKSFVEYDKTGYVLFSADDYYGAAKEMKRTIAKELPSEVKLIVYTQSSNKNTHLSLVNDYSQYLAKDRFHIVQVPRSGSNDFWTRDNMPLPVWDGSEFVLVDAKYYYNFEPDQFISKIFSARLDSHPYFFEGGNFIVNGRGECLVVNRKRHYSGGTSDTAAIPDHVFKNKYGCNKLIRLQHLKGIGHSDEVVKFLADDIILTNTHQYVSILENVGYQVHLLPEPDLNYGTYANSLIVNDVIFLPVFDEHSDREAIDIYKNLNLGYKIIPIQSRQLTVRGQGSIHCITMNYPPTPMHKLLDHIDGKLIH